MLKNISCPPFPYVKTLSQPPEDQKLKWQELQRVQLEHNINIIIEYYTTTYCYHYYYYFCLYFAQFQLFL